MLDAFDSSQENTDRQGRPVEKMQVPKLKSMPVLPRMEHSAMNMNSAQKDLSNLHIPMAIQEEYGGGASDLKDPQSKLD